MHNDCNFEKYSVEIISCLGQFIDSYVDCTTGFCKSCSLQTGSCPALVTVCAINIE